MSEAGMGLLRDCFGNDRIEYARQRLKFFRIFVFSASEHICIFFASSQSKLWSYCSQHHLTRMAARRPLLWSLIVLFASRGTWCWNPSSTGMHDRTARTTTRFSSSPKNRVSSSSTKIPPMHSMTSKFENRPHREIWKEMDPFLPFVVVAVVWGSAIIRGEFFLSSCQAAELPASSSVSQNIPSTNSVCTQQQSVQSLFQKGFISERDIFKLCEMNDCAGAGQGRCATTTTILTIPLQSSEPMLLPGSLIPTLYPTWQQQLSSNDESNKIYAVGSISNMRGRGLYGDRLDHYFESILDGLDK